MAENSVYDFLKNPQSTMTTFPESGRRVVLQPSRFGIWPSEKRDGDIAQQGKGAD